MLTFMIVLLFVCSGGANVTANITASSGISGSFAFSAVLPLAASTVNLDNGISVSGTCLSVTSTLARLLYRTPQGAGAAFDTVTVRVRRSSVGPSQDTLATTTVTVLSLSLGGPTNVTVRENNLTALPIAIHAGDMGMMRCGCVSEWLR